MSFLGSVGVFAQRVKEPEKGAAAKPAGSQKEPNVAMKLPVMRIAMQDLSLQGVDPRVGLLVQNALLAELRKLKGISVVSLDEVRAMIEVEAQKNDLGCGDESCMSEIAAALGADVVLIGTLVRVGDEHLFGLKRVSQEEAKVLGQVNRRLVAEDGEEFLAAIGPAVEELFPGRVLRKGQERGVADEVALRLNPPPLSPWVFWSLSGTTLVAFGAASLAGLFSMSSALQYQKLLERSKNEAVFWRELKSARGESQTALGFAVGLSVVGIVTGSIAAVSALFVDWKGYGDIKE